ncbi:MAG: galactokinase family protein [Oscillospiraceae bacterium]
MITKFKELYQDDLANQTLRYEKLTRDFESFFGYKNGIEFFSAPGRTEVGGNHTDHQHGCVLAAAINLDIIAAAARRTDGIVTLKSFEYAKYDKIDVADLAAKREEREKSSALIRGILSRCKQLGYRVGGFDCFTVSSVLKGSGLSSSAAFEVLVVTVISHLFNDDQINPVEAAQIAQYAENVYFGKPSGLLDQTASSVGGFTAIDFADPAKPKFEKIDFNLEKYGYSLCVVDTGGCHADITNEYNAIPLEMKKVAKFCGKTVLRDVDENEFYAKLKEVRANSGDRATLRAIHFFDDNRSAVEEAEALKLGDFEQFKALVIQSGISSATRLQNVFASSNPSEQGLSLALAVSEKVLAGKGAYRVHGGGFAGTIQAYVPNGILPEYVAKIENVFGKNSCYVLSVRSAGGTKIEQ